MIFRVNLLLGAALVLAMAFYLVGRYLIVGPVGWVKPDWAPVAAGIWLLMSLMLGVSSLADVQTRLSALPVPVVRRLGLLGVAGQALILAGHALAAIAAYRWFTGSLALNLLVVMLPAIVYALGVALAILDLRARTHRAAT